MSDDCPDPPLQELFEVSQDHRHQDQGVKSFRIVVDPSQAVEPLFLPEGFEMSALRLLIGYLSSASPEANNLLFLSFDCIFLAFNLLFHPDFTSSMDCFDSSPFFFLICLLSFPSSNLLFHV